MADPTITVRGRGDFSGVQSGLKKLTGAAAAAVAGVAAAGAAAAREAVNQQKDIARAAAQLGASPAEQKKLGQVAGKVYAQAYGESFEEVSSSVAAVRGQFRSLGTGPELERVTKQAMGVADAFGLDVTRAVSVARTAVKSGLAKDATGALDLITRSAQKVGPAMTEEVLDASEEYGQFFTNLGFNGSQAFATLAAGAARGQYGVDKAGDAVKEFTIRATDMSTASVGAYDLIGLNAEKMADRLLSGGDQAQDATQKIIKGLLGIESPSQRANAAIALFGTPLEDLGVNQIPGFLRSLQQTEGGLKGVDGAADRVGKTLGNTTASKITQFKRTVTQAIVDEVGKRALPVLSNLADAGTKIAQAWKTGGVDAAVEQLEDLTGAQGKLTPVLKAGRSVIDSVQRILAKVGPAGREAAEGLKPLLAPVALIDDALSAVAGVIEAVPDGLLTLGIQAGAAALILPRLTGAIAATGAAAAAAGTQVMVFGTRVTGAAMAARAGSLTGARTALAGFGSTAKNVAGVGGILALTSGLQEVSEEGTTMSGVLKGAAGGAGIGAMFGPVGALVGAGVGGGLTALVGSFKETKQEAELARLELQRTEGFADAKADAEELAASLAGVIDVYGKVSRAQVEAGFFKDGELEGDVKKLRELGVSMDTIVSATLGQANAQQIVNQAFTKGTGGLEDLQAAARQAKLNYDDIKDGQREIASGPGMVDKEWVSDEEIRKYKDALDAANNAVTEAKNQQDTFGQKVLKTGNALDAHRTKVEGLARNLGVTVAQYNKFPKEVRTRFEDVNGGLVQTREDAVRLIAQYKGLQNFRRIRAIVSAPGVDLTRKQMRDLAQTYLKNPKQIRTLVRLEGGPAAKKGAKEVKDNLNGLNNVKVTMPGVKRGVEGVAREAKGAAARGGREVRESFEKPVKNTSGAMPKLAGSVRGAMGPAKSEASTGGTQIGSNVKSGFGAGFAGADGLWSGQVRGAVRAAINAGKNEAKIKSPSRKTMEIGEQLARGLEVGMKRRAPKAKDSGRALIAAALSGVTGGSDGVGKSLDKLTAFIEKRIDLKDDAKERAREKEVLKSLRGQYAALQKVGRQQDANDQALERGRGLLKERTDAANQYAAAIKSGFVSYGGVVGLGQQEDGSVSTSALLDQLRNRERDAKRFEALINSLRTKLNPTALQELLDRGLEGGALQTAEAIAAGGTAAITEINRLTTSIGAVGGRLGETMRKQFHQAGINAAAGLVAGLERDQKALDRAAERLAKKLAAAVRKALGIKSPSRVFRGIGENTMAGLEIGLDETRAKRAGVTVAKALAAGTATTQLNAMLSGSSGGGGSSPTTWRVVLDPAAQSELARGRRVVLEGNAASSAGVRVLAVGSR